MADDDVGSPNCWRNRVDGGPPAHTVLGPVLQARQVGETARGAVEVQYDPRAFWPYWSPSVNEVLTEWGPVLDGVHRSVYVTVDGAFAGTMCFTENSEYAVCWGQRGQILGVLGIGEDVPALQIALLYRDDGNAR